MGTENYNWPFIRIENGTLNLTWSGNRIIYKDMINDVKRLMRVYKDFWINILKYDEEITKEIITSDIQLNIVRSCESSESVEKTNNTRLFRNNFLVVRN